MSEEIWVAVISGLLGGRTIVELTKLIIQNIKGKKRYTAVYEQTQSIYNILQKGVNTTSTDRGLVLKTTNGGGPPKIDSPLYITVIHEQNSPRIESTQQRYNGVQVDREYIDMLFKLSRENMFFGKVEDLRENTLLRVAYESAGIKEYFIYLIKESSKSYWFGSFSSTQSFTDEEKLTLKALAIDMRRIFRLYKIQ